SGASPSTVHPVPVQPYGAAVGHLDVARVGEASPKSTIAREALSLATRPRQRHRVALTSVDSARTVSPWDEPTAAVPLPATGGGCGGGFTGAVTAPRPAGSRPRHARARARTRFRPCRIDGATPRPPTRRPRPAPSGCRGRRPGGRADDRQWPRRRDRKAVTPPPATAPNGCWPASAVHRSTPDRPGSAPRTAPTGWPRGRRR